MPDLADPLRASLRRLRLAGAGVLTRELGVSQPTLSRLIRAMGGEVVALGQARRRRYALARPVRGLPAALPLYRLSADGRGEALGALRPLAPEGCALEGASGLGWPLAENMKDGHFESLPYFLFDARPQGFLGRAFARAQGPALGVADDPRRWSDDDLLVVLALAGDDLPGDLVLGDLAWERLARRMARPVEALADADLPRAYPALAEAVLAGAVPGSSVGGEFAKFTATLAGPGGPRQVLVKFSAPMDSPAGRRWADLLVAEHLASGLLGRSPGGAAPSRLHGFAGRLFLEVERFDRVGAWGRRPVCTLAAIDAALLGLGDARWDRAADALHQAGLLDAAGRERMQGLWCFGSLIANSDMHPGNIAFLPRDGHLACAPAYDMLPMLYAPTPGGDLPSPDFQPALPRPGLEAPWADAARLAMELWEACAGSDAASPEFRALAGVNRERVARALAAL